MLLQSSAVLLLDLTTTSVSTVSTAIMLGPVLTVLLRHGFGECDGIVR